MLLGEFASCVILLALLLLVFACGHRKTLRRRKSLNTTILVNGTRGKSSTTRLIVAGLRAAQGKIPSEGATGRVLGKTTGTSARWLLPDGTEQKVRRIASPNIREMADGFALAEKTGARLYVAECMAVRQEYQEIVEHAWMRADITVMTNVRVDHEDSVGEGLRATACSLAASLPQEGLLVAHASTVAALASVASFPEDRLVLANPDAAAPWLPLFSEPVVPDNLSLALTVCALLGVPPEQAAPAMAAAPTDPGNLEMQTLTLQGRSISFVGAFAANDPHSTRWLAERHACPPGFLKGLWIHGRRDRRPRSEALCRSLAELRPDFVLLSGDGEFLRRIWQAPCPYGVFSLPLRAEDEVQSVLRALPPGDIWLFGAGNAKGMIPQRLEGVVLCRNLSLA